GDEDPRSALVTQGAKKGVRPGALGDQVFDLPLQRDDVNGKFGGPIVRAVPAQPVLFAGKASVQVTGAGLGIESVQFGEASRQMVLPEMVVEVEVEPGAVHVEQNGVDSAPVDHPT